jgi:hypothetical protein
VRVDEADGGSQDPAGVARSYVDSDCVLGVVFCRGSWVDKVLVKACEKAEYARIGVTPTSEEHEI